MMYSDFNSNVKPVDFSYLKKWPTERLQEESRFISRGVSVSRADLNRVNAIMLELRRRKEMPNVNVTTGDNGLTVTTDGSITVTAASIVSGENLMQSFTNPTLGAMKQPYTPVDKLLLLEAGNSITDEELEALDMCAHQDSKTKVYGEFYSGESDPVNMNVMHTFCDPIQCAVDDEVEVTTDGITKLPDGSAFFTGTVGGPRPDGFVNWLKYTSNATARTWLLLYRNYRMMRNKSKYPGQGPDATRWEALKWTLNVTLGITWFESPYTKVHNRVIGIYNLVPPDITIVKKLFIYLDPRLPDFEGDVWAADLAIHDAITQGLLGQYTARQSNMEKALDALEAEIRSDKGVETRWRGVSTSTVAGGKVAPALSPEYRELQDKVNSAMDYARIDVKPTFSSISSTNKTFLTTLEGNGLRIVSDTYQPMPKLRVRAPAPLPHQTHSWSENSWVIYKNMLV